MISGGQYTIKPENNINPLNGVSTLDLVAIQQHILGLERLDSPYKLIAADVDQSGTITALDIIQLRKLILGIYEEFPNNNSWRLIDGAYNFLDPVNPFAFEFPEEYAIRELVSDMNVDFVGVKIGDVNNTVKANANDVNIESRSNDSVELMISNASLSAGQSIEIPLKADLNSIEGLQLAMNIDLEKAEIKGFIPMAKDLNAANVNMMQKSEGLIRISWHSNKEHDNNDFFTLVLDVKEDCQVSDVLTIGKALNPEAYRNNKAIDLSLEFENKIENKDAIVLHQNVPNPWSEQTNIKFYLPQQDQVVLNLFDMNGRRIFKKQIAGSEGENTISLDKSDLDHSGVLYYQLISGEVQLTKKMILLD